jgi:hypothetical protein
MHFKREQAAVKAQNIYKSRTRVFNYKMLSYV